MFETLQLYLSQPFVQRAIIVGVIIALCSSLLGVILVLKRFSFIGDGLSHVAFGSNAVAAVLGFTNNMLLVMPVTIISAVALLKTGKSTKVKGDATLAMISVGALAFGYMIMNIFGSSANLSGNVCSTLFGSMSILTLTNSDVIICVILSIVVITCFVILYHKIFAITFDETFAKATGVKTERYNFIIAIVIATIIVLAMNLVGSLLVSALIIFPTLSAMRLFKTFKSVTICAAIISVITALSGIITSALADTPVGSTIVTVDAIVFLLCLVLSKIGRKKR